MEKLKKYKFVIQIIILVIIAVLLEAVVFNINSFRLLGNEEYTYKNIEITDEMLHGFKKSGENEYTATYDNPYIYIDNLNMATGTIKIDAQRKEIEKLDDRKLEVIIYYTDVTSAYARYLPEKTINSNVERSKYCVLHLSGNTGYLLTQFNISEGEAITIESIEINIDVPYHFNIIRFALTLLVMLAVFLLFNLKVFEEKYDIKNKMQKAILWSIFAIFILTSIGIISLTSKDNKGIVTKFEHNPNLVYEVYYTNALINGSLSLKVEPGEKLKNMANPYDAIARATEGIDVLYDYAYYNGKYYVYFSIIPQLLFFIPFKLITGQYLNLMYPVLIFCGLGSLFAMLSIRKIINKYFKKANFRITVLSVITALFASMTLYIVGRPKVYEVVASCGYWLIMQAVYCFIKAFEKKDGKIEYCYLTLGCISAAAAVNARPNLLIVSLLFLPIFLDKFAFLCSKIKKAQDKQAKKYELKNMAKFILSIVLPYGIIGASMMVLNYVRFDSITEFGARYQLTSNDMTNLGYRLSTIPLGLWHYLFNPPVIDLTFPFIHMEPVTPLYLGFYGCGYVGVGTFFMAPICVLLIFLPMLKQKLKEKSINLYENTRNSLIVAIIMIVAITLLAASYQRYALDFTWMIVWPAIIIVLLIHELLVDNDLLKKIYEKLIFIATLICVLTTLAMSIKSEANNIEKYSTEIYDNIAASMMFWE